MKKGQCLQYEWVVWAAQNGDEHDPDTEAYCDSYAEAFRWSQGTVDFLYIELRRKVWDKKEHGGGVLDETHAFVKNGKLPEFFDNGAKVPKGLSGTVTQLHNTDAA